jgi:hypothetical protein
MAQDCQTWDKAQDGGSAWICRFQLSRGGGADAFARMAAKSARGNGPYGVNKSEIRDKETEVTHPGVPVKWTRYQLDPMQSR